MAKNILIFSDGTGQAGGVTFDENRSNIYKLFRATRCGPDSTIDPSEQVAFYDPGLGSPRDNHFTFGWVGRKIYNLISQGTGSRQLRSPAVCFVVTLTGSAPHGMRTRCAVSRSQRGAIGIKAAGANYS